MPYKNHDFIDAVNQSTPMMEGKLIIFKKRGSAIRANVDSEVEFNSKFFGDEIVYREGGRKQSVTLSDVVSINGIKYADYHYSF